MVVILGQLGLLTVRPNLKTGVAHKFPAAIVEIAGHCGSEPVNVTEPILLGTKS